MRQRRSFWDRQADARRRSRRLALGFVLCIALCLASVHGGLTLAWWVLFPGLPYPRGFVLANLGVTLFLILGGWWLEHEAMRGGGRKLAQRIGARPVQPERHADERRLQHIVLEMCVAAHMTPPQVVLLARAHAINAFAAGWEPEDAVIAVTQGALDCLSRDELQGLVAHELSHLKEGDTRLNMQMAGMVYGLELIYNFGQALREHAGGLGRWFGSAVMAAGWIGWLGGRVLKAAVSRQREWLADARALQWTRNPDSLGGVLRKVLYQRQQAEAASGGDWREERHSHTGLYHPLVQHMLLVEVPDSSRLEHWLDAHPPLEQRIARVYGRRMSALEARKATPER